jgi:hypothetical protein
MPTVEIRSRIDAPWIDVEPLILGSTAAGPGTPEAYVTVESEEGPALRVDLYKSGDQSYAFSDAHVWSHFLVIGWGHFLYLVELRTRDVTSRDLGSYFGHAYPTERFLLVASAERLFRIDTDGSLSWRSDPLGMDGVIVAHISADQIEGQGEWDPPGGWTPFCVSAFSGKLAPPETRDGGGA